MTPRTGSGTSDVLCPIERLAQRRKSHKWMPKSGYGPYCTIPPPALARAELAADGLESFADARRDLEALAESYRQQATELAKRAHALRLDLCHQVRGPAGEAVIRPNRLRLYLTLREGYLYLGWRGVVKVKKKWKRISAGLWDGASDLQRLLEGADPAEIQLVLDLDEQAQEIRLRWFALVRTAYHLNVVADYQHLDVARGSGLPRPGAEPAWKRLLNLVRATR